MNRVPIWRTCILECCNGSYYVGSSGDFEARVRVHQSGNGPAYTAARLPIRLAYSEQHATLATLQDAVARERQLKGWSRAKKAALVAGDREGLHALSKRRTDPTTRDCS